MGNIKIDSRTFFAKVEMSSKFCFVASRRLSFQHGTCSSYSKFGFSRPDLNGNKLAKGMCLTRKVRYREVFI